MKDATGKNWRIAAVLLAAFGLVVGAVYGYGRLNGRFEAIEKKVEKAEQANDRLIRLEEGVEYLKSAVDRIEKNYDKRKSPRELLKRYLTKCLIRPTNCLNSTKSLRTI